MRLPFVDPRTIRGQLTGLILLSVVIALGLSIGAALFLFSSIKDRPQGEPPMTVLTIMRLVAVAKSDAEVSAIVTNAQRVGLSVQVISRGHKTSFGSDRVADPARTDAAFARLMSAPGMAASNLHLYLAPDGTMRLPLHNGSDLAFPVPNRSGAFFPGFLLGPLLYTLVIIGVFVLAISLYAARFITAPLSSFAAAAYAFGRSASGDQSLVERGPQEVVQLARALNEMRERIMTLINERTNTLTAISHDLRTPLTRMKLRVERMSKTGSENTLADAMFADIARMEQMLSETLAYLRDDARSEAPVSVDLPSILQSICTELSDLGEPVEYHGPERFVLICKPSALTRAITNLVDNALKYGTRVSVSLRPSNANVQIDVTDNGPGIPYSFRKRVFEPFFRVDAARTFDVGKGFGLGLSIVKNIVEDHGGVIDLLACDPQGLDVRIVLPSSAANDES